MGHAMTAADIVARARSAIGHHTIYALGRGGRHPEAALPGDGANRCDCSGFAAWAVGLDRHQPGSPTLAKFNGGWLSTDGILHDSGLFVAVEVPLPGDLVAYGDHLRDGRKRQGHVGVVVEANGSAWDALRVVHCSLRNWRVTGDAIQETGAAVFQSRGQFRRFVP